MRTASFAAVDAARAPRWLAKASSAGRERVCISSSHTTIELSATMTPRCVVENQIQYTETGRCWCRKKATTRPKYAAAARARSPRATLSLAPFDRPYRRPTPPLHFRFAQLDGHNFDRYGSSWENRRRSEAASYKLYWTANRHPKYD